MRLDNAQSVHLAGWALLATLGVLVAMLLLTAPGLAKDRAVFCTQQYDPVCARVDAGKRCVRPPCPGVLEDRTYANACFARAAGARILYKGVCKPAARDVRGRNKAGCNDADPARDPTCRSWTDGCNICRRARPGAPAACTKMACAKKGPARCLVRFGERF